MINWRRLSGCENRASFSRSALRSRAIRSAGLRQSWVQAPELQALMTRAVRNSRAPIFFFQAENDYDLSPSRTLSAAMKDAGKTYELKIYPPYGKSAQEGHTFGY